MNTTSWQKFLIIQLFIIVSILTISGCTSQETMPDYTNFVRDKNAIYLRQIKKPMELPKGCKIDSYSKEYDCGAGVTGLDLCMHTIKYLSCSSKITDRQEVKKFIARYNHTLNLNGDTEYN